MKGIFHIHTHYSYDSFTSPKSIVLHAAKLNMDLLVITDHDTLKGSIAAREIADLLKLKIEIPVAGEFFTDVGDIIVANVPENFMPSFSHKELCKRAKEQGGITILPHPFDGHDLEKIRFDLIDSIEVYNSRSKPENNAKAEELAKTLGKPILFGSDAHFLKDMTNSIFEFTGTFPYFKSINPLPPVNTPHSRKALSQVIKGIKKRDLKIILKNIKEFLIHSS